MEIHDKEGNLLALIIRGNEMTEGKNFFTNDNSRVSFFLGRYLLFLGLFFQKKLNITHIWIIY